MEAKTGNGYAEHLAQLRSDLRKATAEMGDQEVRFLVDTYYQMQEYRKRAANQSRAAGEDAEPHAALVLILGEFERLESAIRSAMDTWTDAQHMGAWAKAHVGIGPVIAAGLQAHIDPERASTAGSVWAFAGLNPDAVWKKGQKRPWNARLKVLAWKIGDSFVKQSGHDDCFYGKEYRKRKEYELKRDAEGGNAEEAKRTLENRNIKDSATRKTYESGHLPPGRLDLRARRYATKLFLAHYWQEAREHADLPVPLPYPIAHLGHAHIIEPPDTE